MRRPDLAASRRRRSAPTITTTDSAGHRLRHRRATSSPSWRVDFGAALARRRRTRRVDRREDAASDEDPADAHRRGACVPISVPVLVMAGDDDVATLATRSPDVRSDPGGAAGGRARASHALSKEHTKECVRSSSTSCLARCPPVTLYAPCVGIARRGTRRTNRDGAARPRYTWAQCWTRFRFGRAPASDVVDGAQPGSPATDCSTSSPPSSRSCSAMTSRQGAQWQWGYLSCTAVRAGRRRRPASRTPLDRLRLATHDVYCAWRCSEWCCSAPSFCRSGSRPTGAS